MILIKVFVNLHKCHRVGIGTRSSRWSRSPPLSHWVVTITMRRTVMTINSTDRCNDVQDIWYIIHHCQISFDGKTLLALPPENDDSEADSHCHSDVHLHHWVYVPGAVFQSDPTILHCRQKVNSMKDVDGWAAFTWEGSISVHSKWCGLRDPLVQDTQRIPIMISSYQCQIASRVFRGNLALFCKDS